MNIKTIIAPAALLVLAACNSAESAEPATPVQTSTPVADPTPTLPAPDQEIFTATFAEACPKAEKVSTALCKSQGFGKEGFVCEYGLGADQYRRNSASLVPGDGKWVLADPENACSAGKAG
jgi:hypothetical protein